MSQPALKYYTEEEYLAFEKASEERHEYYTSRRIKMCNIIMEELKIKGEEF